MKEMVSHPAFASRVAARIKVVEDELRAAGASADLAIASVVEHESTQPLTLLRDRLQLTASEESVLWTLIAHELGATVRTLVRDLDGERPSDPTVDTVRRVVYGSDPTAAGWQELSSQGALSRYGLISRIGAVDAPLYRQALKVSERVLALVHGHVGLDPAVLAFARFTDEACDLGELEIPAGVVDAARKAMAKSSPTILCSGMGTGRRSLLTALVGKRGQRALIVQGRAISGERELATRQLRDLVRECALFDAVPLVESIDALAERADACDRLEILEAELAGLVLGTSTKPIARRWKRPPALIELPPLTGTQRTAVWARALPMASTSDADHLATLYPFAPSIISAVAAAAIAECGANEMLPEHIASGVRAVLDDRLAGLASRVRVTQTWDDLVLPEEQTLGLIELLARIRERRRVYEDWGFASKLGRGLGTAALFSGPPGTGKTMCAGLVARDLGTELYQVDVSRITSKWIGETEKNLAALFDAAEAGHAILLFDEADTIFGKRTDVRSSNDRHANQETNYLLQRLESFTGICILTTNHESALDEAFRRRLSVHVRFPLPEADERKRLWQALLPDSAPLGADLHERQFERLAETYAMSGGYIRNAVLRAAFLAANQNTSIDATHLIRAAQLEYEAIGKVVSRH